MRILHVAAEAHPLIKTGGLADVLGSLPAAQHALGHRVSVLLPGYRAVMAAAGTLEPGPTLNPPGGPSIQLLRGELSAGVELLVLDQADYFDRPGGPYGDEQGNDWPDNHLRFALLGRAGAGLCLQDPAIDVLNAHDWHAGLAPAYLEAWGVDCASCFTIHNLAYQGRFAAVQYPDTDLPGEFYRYDGLEYHGDWSFMKAGLSYSDAITTVSPSYAREILQPQAGMGLHALLNYRRRDFVGILNGVDYRVWDPSRDAVLESNYSTKSLQAKQANKKYLQQSLRMEPASDRLLVGVVSRLTTHKGLDLVPAAIEDLLASGRMQLSLLGSGDAALEASFKQLASRYSQNCAVVIGYDEIEAHRIFGGADAILIPSRFEPCGLTQMYGLRYGSLPVVRKTGGLADTVIGYKAGNPDSANGLVFNTASVTALRRVLNRAVKLYTDRDLWKGLMRNAMRADFGWDKSARAYLDLYARLIAR